MREREEKDGGEREELRRGARKAVRRGVGAAELTVASSRRPVGQRAAGGRRSSSVGDYVARRWETTRLVRTTAARRGWRLDAAVGGGGYGGGSGGGKVAVEGVELWKCLY
ncbi:hypothetical protein Scep_021648 [Stephania cephalantha]|uniref:Uncharacterized protein n=1 Tax=Stephania cephalantha TaxID=152367 RepID=A0AAP0I212_9MAGN